jgi:hypothetical protein
VPCNDKFRLGLGLWWLTPLPTIFQLYHGWTKPELTQGKPLVTCQTLSHNVVSSTQRCLLPQIFRIYHGFEMQNTDYGFVCESMVSVAFQNYNFPHLIFHEALEYLYIWVNAKNVKAIKTSNAFGILLIYRLFSVWEMCLLENPKWKDVSSQSCKAGSGFGGGRSRCQSYAAKEKKTNPAEV